jgi:hypothetical protein
MELYFSLLVNLSKHYIIRVLAIFGLGKSATSKAIYVAQGPPTDGL